MEHYIETEAYNAIVSAIMRRWNLDPDDVKIALGEGGNVWSRSIRPDEMRTTHFVIETARRLLIAAL